LEVIMTPVQSVRRLLAVGLLATVCSPAAAQDFIGEPTGPPVYDSLFDEYERWRRGQTNPWYR
jgi:hypothetical protein